METFAMPIDIELSYIQKKYDFDIYWSIPYITKQGTIEGVYSSNIRKGSLTLKINHLLKKIEKRSPLIANFLAILLKETQILKNRIKSGLTW